MIRKKVLLAAICSLMLTIVVAQKTTVTVDVGSASSKIDPMIYGQMLENVNDSMIYGGVADLRGNERRHVTELVKQLDIPVMRWPGGTVIHEYRWRNGIGPKELRPTSETFAWKGIENYQFGTDEFLDWSERIGAAPYINFNMANHPEYGGTIWEALEWMEYVNGSAETPLGKLRATYGREKPYDVKYWCIGNENYGPWGRHHAETDTAYAKRLRNWASVIKSKYPDVALLGIGRSVKWNSAVLDSCGEYLDFLTQHYYVTSKVKDGKIENAYSTLFAPQKMERHLQMLGDQLRKYNSDKGSAERPVRLSIDEWNNRHSVNTGENYKFSRQSPRRQFDVPVAAGMLNVFIRQSPEVGMANYIFPVNAHGLIRTVGETDAFITPLFHVFKQYRQVMVGRKAGVTVEGPGIGASQAKITIDGDAVEADLGNDLLSFVDAAAVLNEDGNVYVSIVNRSVDAVQNVDVLVPGGYNATGLWQLTHENIHEGNTLENRSAVVPKTSAVKSKKGKLTLRVPACGLMIVTFTKK